VEVPKYISKGLAREIVEFMESYDKAFGYTDELEGQSSKEEWINTVQEAFSRGEGKGYVDTVLRLKEDTTIAMKQAIKIETELIKCKEKEMPAYFGSETGWKNLADEGVRKNML